MFGLFKETEKKLDTYEQMSSILNTLLTYEIRDLPLRYEFWYRVAIRQEEYRTLQAEHREKISMHTAIGRFHQVQYEDTKQKCAKLERLTDIYKLLCIEEERQTLNHRLSFHKEAIEEIYGHVQRKHLYTYCDAVQRQFWDAVGQTTCFIVLILYLFLFQLNIEVALYPLVLSPLKHAGKVHQ